MAGAAVLTEIREFTAGNPGYVLAIVALLWFVLGVFLGARVPRRRRTREPRPGRGGDRASKHDSCEIYVGNIPYEMGDSDLRKLLDPFGKVVSARVILNRGSGASKGYGFARMSSAQEVGAAIDALNGREVQGRRIIVSEARTQPRDRRG